MNIFQLKNSYMNIIDMDDVCAVCFRGKQHNVHTATKIEVSYSDGRLLPDETVQQFFTYEPYRAHIRKGDRDFIPLLLDPRVSVGTASCGDDYLMYLRRKMMLATNMYALSCEMRDCGDMDLQTEIIERVRGTLQVEIEKNWNIYILGDEVVENINSHQRAIAKMLNYVESIYKFYLFSLRISIREIRQYLANCTDFEIQFFDGFAKFRAMFSEITSYVLKLYKYSFAHYVLCRALTSR